jgi:DNA repair photolyase
MHQDFAAHLRGELSALGPQTIYIGMNTDPYQPVEAKYRQTRQALELLVELGFSACILTKSDLVVRDIGLLKRMTDSSAGVSSAFQDGEVRRLFELLAPPNEKRIEALMKLKKAGIGTYALICPVMPYITDVEALIEVVASVADTIWVYPLRMKSERDRNWQNIYALLKRCFPEIAEQYREVIFTSDHPYWLDLDCKLEDARLRRGLNLRVELGKQRSSERAKGMR